MKAVAIALLIAPAFLAGCTPNVSAAEFVTAHAKDAQSVIAAVQEVEQATRALADDDSGDTAALVSYDGVLSDAQSTFDRVNHNLLNVAKPNSVEATRDELWSATDELSEAMKSARAYIDDRKPSQLADYKRHWNQGRAWWNQAVTAIWQAASVSPMPTIENAPTAPPLSSS